MATRHGQPELRLIERARSGDRDARRRLVDGHMGPVRSLARRYREMGLPVEDLEQEGAIGLLEAIEHFDPLRGASFSTYAYWRARRAMTHALTDHGRLLRLPKRVSSAGARLPKRPQRSSTGVAPRRRTRSPG